MGVNLDAAITSVADFVAVALVTLRAQLSQKKHDVRHRARLGNTCGLRWRGSAARTASKPEFGFQGEAAVVTTLGSAFLTRSTLFCSPMNSVPTPISPRS